jgi:hypothetical protein
MCSEGFQNIKLIIVVISQCVKVYLASKNLHPNFENAY